MSAFHRIADMKTQNVRLPYESGRESAMCRTADNSHKETLKGTVRVQRKRSGEIKISPLMLSATAAIIFEEAKHFIRVCAMTKKPRGNMKENKDMGYPRLIGAGILLPETSCAF